MKSNLEGKNNEGVKNVSLQTFWSNSLLVLKNVSASKEYWLKNCFASKIIVGIKIFDVQNVLGLRLTHY